MPISNYNTGFPQGVTIRNVPILDIQNGDGNVFWVNSVTGSNNNKGTFKYPLESLLKALTLVKANQGDKIFIAAGHTETISDATTYNITTPGIQIFGMGSGRNRAVFTITTISTAVLNISADDVYIGNLVFNTNIGIIDNVVKALSVDGLTVENCQFDGTDDVQDIFLISGDNNKFINCYFKIWDSSTATTSAIKVVEDTDNLQILDCIIIGAYSEACILFDSAIFVTNCFIDGGELKTSDIDGFALKSTAVTASSAIVSKNVNMIVSNSEKLPIYSENNAKIGQDNLGEVISIAAVVNVSKISGSSAYLLDVQAGSYMLEDVIWETDATPLGGATNVEIGKETGTYGSYGFFEETVATLVARTTVELADASVIGHETVLGTDSQIQINSTGATLTGNDNRITFKLRSLESGSNIIKNPSF